MLCLAHILPPDLKVQSEICASTEDLGDGTIAAADLGVQYPFPPEADLTSGLVSQCSQPQGASFSGLGRQS